MTPLYTKVQLRDYFGPVSYLLSTVISDPEGARQTIEFIEKHTKQSADYTLISHPYALSCLQYDLALLNELVLFMKDNNLEEQFEKWQTLAALDGVKVSNSAAMWGTMKPRPEGAPTL
jgi:hypothetical protein